MDGRTEKDEIADAVAELSDDECKIDEVFHVLTADVTGDITIGRRLIILRIGLLLWLLFLLGLVSGGERGVMIGNGVGGLHGSFDTDKEEAAVLGEKCNEKE